MVEAANYLEEQIQASFERGEKVLLLLSGGSAIEIYKNLGQWLKSKPDGFGQNLTVGLVDERYGKVGHEDGNEIQIEQTGFYEVVKEKGGHILSVLTGKEPADEANNYNDLIDQNLKPADKVMAVLGVGPDGHTAGILPQESLEKFDKLFPKDEWAIYYELPQDYPNPFKRRITLTPHALEKINLAVVVAKSKGKEEALKRMFSPDESVYRTPAISIRNLRGVLFTDWDDAPISR